MTTCSFKKGQKLICVHYRDKPTVVVDEINLDGYRGVEVWVKEGDRLWWGPVKWFKAKK